MRGAGVVDGLLCLDDCISNQKTAAFKRDVHAQKNGTLAIMCTIIANVSKKSAILSVVDMVVSVASWYNSVNRSSRTLTVLAMTVHATAIAFIQIPHRRKMRLATLETLTVPATSTSSSVRGRVTSRRLGKNPDGEVISIAVPMPKNNVISLSW